MNATQPPIPSDAPHSTGRANHWQIRDRMLDLGNRPLLMGIVNVTPDSFSDGGRFLQPTAAIDHALELVAQGADILDIGGESTRPGALPVDVAEELRRVMPVITGLAGKTDVPLSIDTTKALVAQEALAAGVRVVNDITALTGDPAMLEVVLRSGCGVCAMHMPGTPQTMQSLAVYRDVVHDVSAYLRARRDALAAAGISWARVALDPGIGFGKTVHHNLALLRAAREFHELGCPLLFGVSRKRFIGEVLTDPAADRTAGTIGAALALACRGVQVLRVHDVGAVRRAVDLFQATGGLDP